MEEQIQKIYERLCDLVPRRPDLHQKMMEEFREVGVSWEIQNKIVEWVEKFQAPIYDTMTQSWKKNLPQEIEIFLPKLEHHLEFLEKGIEKYKNNLYAGASGRCK